MSNVLNVQDEGDPDKPKHSPPGPLVGVTVEVAVAISLASFLVGAGSTGVLWFIHSKAEKVKTVGQIWIQQASHIM